MEIDELLASPSSVGVHSTIALTGSGFLPATAKNSNEPGLESNNIFGTPSNRKVAPMKSHHLIMLVLLAVAAFFAYQYFTTGAI
jgi:hypothetical protein